MPTRMCVACRARKPAGSLLRFRRRSDGHVVPAIQSKRTTARTGRSAWLCPSRVCYETAIKRRAFARALAGPKGLSVAVPGSTLWVDVERAVTDQVEQLRRSSAVDIQPSAQATARGNVEPTTSLRLNNVMQLHASMRAEHGALEEGSNEGVRHGQGSSL